MDVIYLAGVFLFYALTAALVVGCHKLGDWR